MRFYSHNKHRQIPTLYVKISTSNLKDILNMRNVMRQDFDYDGWNNNWLDYIVIENDIMHILPLIRICYNCDKLAPYNPFGEEYLSFTYMRMKLRI